MIACQLASWGWFSVEGGKLDDTEFLIFSGAMMLGQIGASIETFLQKAWGTLIIQFYFFCFTVYGGVVRFLGM